MRGRIARPSSNDVSLFAHVLGHVGAAHEWSAEHCLEPDRLTVVAPGVELLGPYETRHREITSCRLQVLADGRDIRLDSEQVAQQLLDFFWLLTKSDHQ